MPANVACPKCKTKYKLPDNLIGKPVKCQKCGAGFKVGQAAKAPASAGAKRMPQSSKADADANELKKMGLDGPIQHTSEAIFDSSPPADAGAGLLGNLATDPGFSAPKVEDEEQEDVGVLFENPALGQKKKKKKSEFVYTPQRQGLEDHKPEPFVFRDAIKEVWFLCLLILGLMSAAGIMIPYFGGEGLSYISLITRSIVGVVGLLVSIWGCVLAYKTSESVLVLLLCIFVPFYIFYFTATNWKAMKPYFLAFIVCCVVSVMYVPFDLMGGDGF